MRTNHLRLLAPAVMAVMILAACGSSQAATSTAAPSTPVDASDSQDQTLVIVATTSILGDVVSQVVGDAAEVETIMPAGSDPHDFEASAQQVAALEKADLVVANGLELEQSLIDPLQNAEDTGIPVFHATDHVETIPFGEHGEEHGHDEGGEHESEEEHADEGGEHADEGGEHAHEHEGGDPHFWQDPTRMAEAVRALGTELDELTSGTEMSAAAEEYASSLDDLDTEVAALVEEVAEKRRILVTNHDAFGYFADGYGYEIVGTVIPSGSTNAEPSAQELAELAETIREADVPAIFAENTVEPRTAEALAAEVGSDVEVAELYSDSLGQDGSGAETYVTMIRTNAETISSALSP